MRKKIKTQLLFSFALIVLSELLYRFWPVQGFNQPFTPAQNFGSWFDLLIMGKLSRGHWVAFNAVPTAAHTIWGVLAGMLLRSDRTERNKLKVLLIAGIIGIIAGYALDLYTPIIKRICTSSFVIVTGGWCLLTLALSYWLIDMKNVRRIPHFFAIVGMNSLFIYLFDNTGGSRMLRGIVEPFTEGFLFWSGEMTVQIITALMVWFLMWYICYWLYRRKIFIKI
jgi:predicted acyltransferase